MAYDLEEQEKLDELKAWWAKYGNLVAGLVVIIALGIAGTNGWSAYQGRQNAQAGAVYDQLQKAVAAKDTIHVRETTAMLLDQYARTPYAEMAALVAAHFNVSSGDLKTAKAQLQWTLDHASDESYKWIAKLRLAGIQLDEGTPDVALATLSGKVPATFEIAFADRRGDVYVVMNKPEEARKEYQSALDKIALPDADPGQTGYKQVLELKVDALGSGVFTSPPAVANAAVVTPVVVPSVTPSQVTPVPVAPSSSEKK